MTKNEDISKPFEVIERQMLEVENVVEKNKDFTILFFSQLYTQLDTKKFVKNFTHMSVQSGYVCQNRSCAGIFGTQRCGRLHWPSVAYILY